MFCRRSLFDRFPALLPSRIDALFVIRRVSLTILDGQGAIRYLNDVLSPIVVCVFDRSVADESAAEQVVQLRNSRGEPIALSTQLGWAPPAGVEALGFTVAL